jgi:hypothetical protein
VDRAFNLKENVACPLLFLPVILSPAKNPFPPSPQNLNLSPCPLPLLREGGIKF